MNLSMHQLRVFCLFVCLFLFVFVFFPPHNVLDVPFSYDI